MQVADIYTRLLSFEKGKNQGKAYPIHKPLRFDEQDIAQGISDINDLIEVRISPKRPLTILDAGCGVGYSLIRLCSQEQVSGLGVSLSKAEIDFAIEEARARGLEQECTFSCQSFDEEFGQRFDVILGLESIKHATDWRKSVGHLTRSLQAQGEFFLVEDFFLGNPESRIAQRFQRAWNVPELFSLEEVKESFRSFGLEEIADLDLSNKVIKKHPRKLKLIEFFLRALLFILPKGDFSKLLKIYQGAVLMDYLYATKKFSYRLLHLRGSDAESETERKPQMKSGSKSL